MYIIAFHIKFVQIISRNYKIAKNYIVSILRLFWQLIKKNILRLIMNISETKTNYHIFFKDFLHKFILIYEIGQMRVLRLKYRKKIWVF